MRILQMFFKLSKYLSLAFMIRSAAGNPTKDRVWGISPESLLDQGCDMLTI